VRKSVNLLPAIPNLSQLTKLDMFNGFRHPQASRLYNDTGYLEQQSLERYRIVSVLLLSWKLSLKLWLIRSLSPGMMRALQYVRSRGCSQWSLGVELCTSLGLE
jgi:hypothetical protein